LQALQPALAKRELYLSTIYWVSIYFNTNESQVAPVLKAKKSGIGTQYSMFAISTNKALLRFSGILKSSPLKDTMSDHRNTQGYLSKEQQMLWEMDRRFGVSRCRGGLDGLDWGMMKSGQPLSATPLTARVEGKCESHL